MAEAMMKRIGIGLVIGGCVLSTSLLFWADEWEAVTIGVLPSIGGIYVYLRSVGMAWPQIVIGMAVAVVPLVGPLVILVYVGLREFGGPLAAGRAVVKVAGITLAGVVLVPLLAVFLTTHTADLYDRLTLPPPGEGIVLPEDALPDDDALATLEKLGEPIHHNGKLCDGLDLKRTIEGPCVEKVLQQAAGPLATLDAWMAGPSRQKLDRPANLGQHLRVHIDMKHYVSAKIPNYIAIQNIGRALAYRATLRASKGDQAGAQQDLRAIFALGDFLQQNPILIGQMIGIAVYGFGLAATDYVASPMPPSGIETMLPSPQAQREGIRYAYRTEYGGAWYFFPAYSEWTKESVEYLVTGPPRMVPLPVQRALGWYSPLHSLRMIVDYYRLLLAGIDQGHIVSAKQDPQKFTEEACDRERQLLWLRNPTGRAAFCVVALSGNYAARTEVSIDRVEAMKVVLAARRYYQKERRWPTQESELVPASLKAWPVSALDRQPIRWTADKRGLQMLKEDGKTLCDAATDSLCLFRFEPPQSVAAGGKPSPRKG